MYPKQLYPVALGLVLYPFGIWICRIPKATMDGLKEMGLFGLQIPQEYGGLGLSNSAYARIAEEVVLDPSIAVTLMAHQSIGLKGILLDGTEEQKQKYLPKLATGEEIAAFCLTEPNAGSDAASVQCRAIPSDDGKEFVLNGSKMWISNGGMADVFTVFAQTPVKDEKTGETKDKVTAFIVEKAFGGVEPGKPETKLGIRGSNTVQLTFDNCRIPRENVLGEVGGGFKVAMTILNNGRFGLGAGTAGAIKRLMGMIAEHANERKQFGKPLAEFGLIQKKFTEMAAKAYAIESMAYATTGLLDSTNIDCAVEAAICKIYGSEAMWTSVNECIQILGGMGFMAGEGAPPYERFMRDTRILMIFEGTNEILRLFVALTCIQGPGAELSELQKQVKSNPLSIAGKIPDMLRKFVSGKTGIGLQSIPGLRSELKKEGDNLSKYTTEFSNVVRDLLMKYNKDIINQQRQLERVADIAIDLYAMSTSLSRASSTNAGKEVADHEVELAKYVALTSSRRIEDNLKLINSGEDVNGDKLCQNISSTVLSSGRYLPPHPLGV